LTDDAFLESIATRVGRLHARQRLGIERDHEAQVFGQGLNFFHIENFTASHFVIEWVLKLTGLYWRGKKNAERITIQKNAIASEHLPAVFDGFTILHISDLHADMNEAAMANLGALLEGIAYDLCVITGDFRGKTFGPFEPALRQIQKVRRALNGPIYAILGNHDTIRMTPGLERMGIRVLLNESYAIERGDARIHLVGVDDAHFYRADNLEKATATVPHDEFSILLSHTPEIYRQAAHAEFNVLLAGHTHGGQICLPGGIPITLDSKLPRSLGSGPWVYGNMNGYTSVGAGSSLVPVRFNCPPEVTLHRLAVKGEDREASRFAAG
jgi:predicted MPP superfamily phosphohydrolase